MSLTRTQRLALRRNRQHIKTMAASFVVSMTMLAIAVWVLLPWPSSRLEAMRFFVFVIGAVASFYVTGITYDKYRHNKLDLEE